MNDNSAATFVLRIETGKQKGRTLAGGTQELRLGRERPCEALIDEHTVSRHHATITFDGTAFSIADAQSANGTFVNGERVWDRQRLTHGDVIGLGPDVQLRFELVTVSSTTTRLDAAGTPANSTILSGLTGYLRQRPLLLGGFGLYFLALSGLAWFLASAPSGLQRPTKEEASQAVNATMLVLAQSKSLLIRASDIVCETVQACVVSGQTIERTAPQDLSARYRAALYYRKALSLAGYASLDDYNSRQTETEGNTAATARQIVSALENVLAALATDLNTRLLEGWGAEKQQHVAQAIGVYRRVLRVIPLRSAAVFRFAARRIAVLKK